MKPWIIVFLASVITAEAEVKVTVGEISDRRTTGQYFSGLELKLKIEGPELADCKGMRVTIKEQKDDTGKDLAKEDAFGQDGFQPPEKPFGGFREEKKENEFELKLEMANPQRAAKTVKIVGTIDLLMPSKDPASIVTATPSKDAELAVDSPALKMAGATITLLKAEESSLGYKIADPNKKVANVEFCSPDGKPLETSGRMSSGFLGKKTISISLREKAPTGAIAKIYLVTEKSTLSVPLDLSAVALP